MLLAILHNYKYINFLSSSLFIFFVFRPKFEEFFGSPHDMSTVDAQYHNTKKTSIIIIEEYQEQFVLLQLVVIIIFLLLVIRACLTSGTRLVFRIL
jgi:hypothetical protein